MVLFTPELLAAPARKVLGGHFIAEQSVTSWASEACLMRFAQAQVTFTSRGWGWHSKRQVLAAGGTCVCNCRGRVGLITMNPLRQKCPDFGPTEMAIRGHLWAHQKGHRIVDCGLPDPRIPLRSQSHLANDRLQHPH